MITGMNTGKSTGKGEKDALNEIECFIGDKLKELDSFDGDATEKLERLSVLKNLYNFIKNYKENCDALNKHVYKHKFDQYKDIKER